MMNMLANRCKRLCFIPALCTLLAVCWSLVPNVACANGTPAEKQAELQPAAPRQTVIAVVGAGGVPEYDEAFAEWARRWQAAAEQAAARFVLIDDGIEVQEYADGKETADAAESPDDTSSSATAADEAGTDRQRLERLLAEQAESDDDLLWIVLIGHGTFDGHDAKFNLRGPDVTAAELAEWLEGVGTEVVLINCASSSAPFVNKVSGPDRVVVTATRSGYELNFARFGDYLSQAIIDPAADLDKDGQVSLLEAYLTACRRVREFYDQEARLATEHALLDDNGDGLGTPADWFRGVRATQRAAEGAALDGVRAHQIHLVISDREQRMPREMRRQRDELELEIASLRDEKSSLGEERYYAELETLLVELAKLYASIDAESKEGAAPAEASAPE